MTTNGSKEIEQEKLAFEREKLVLEHDWRRRSYRWSIISGVLSAIVAISVAYISTGAGKPTHLTSGINDGPVLACRDSLKRLETLSGNPSTQSEASLVQAIQLHANQCDPVLVQLLAALAP